MVLMVLPLLLRWRVYKFIVLTRGLIRNRWWLIHKQIVIDGLPEEVAKFSLNGFVCVVSPSYGLYANQIVSVVVSFELFLLCGIYGVVQT